MTGRMKSVVAMVLAGGISVVLSSPAAASTPDPETDPVPVTAPKEVADLLRGVPGCC